MSLLLNSSQNNSTIDKKNKFTPNNKYKTKMLNLRKFNQIFFRTSTSRSLKKSTLLLCQLERNKKSKNQSLSLNKNALPSPSNMNQLAVTSSHNSQKDSQNLKFIISTTSNKVQLITSTAITLFSPTINRISVSNL